MKTGELHFGIGDGLSNLVRDAFWFENRQEWGRRTFRCFEGITEDQINTILTGKATLKPIDNGKRVQYIQKTDRKFTKKLLKHILFLSERVDRLNTQIYKLEVERDKKLYGSFSQPTPEIEYFYRGHINELLKERMEVMQTIREYNSLFKAQIKIQEDYESTKALKEEAIRRLGESDKEEAEDMPKPKTKKEMIDIGGFKVPATLLEPYTNHIVKRLRTLMRGGVLQRQDPTEIYNLEMQRQELHSDIIQHITKTMESKEARKFTSRGGDKYKKFADALEKHLEKYGAGL